MVHIIYKNNGQILTFEVRKSILSKEAAKNALHSICLDNGIYDFKNAVAEVVVNGIKLFSYNLQNR